MFGIHARAVQLVIAARGGADWLQGMAERESIELRAFAERVLFGTTLAEKLAPPSGVVTDEQPGPALATPTAPGRPTELRFKPTGRERATEFPGVQQLEQPRERGRLLHFFANHELLATELMALVLLRFPDAPPTFRRGVLRTLQDEQEHTRLYLERMRACGVSFGELPVSGYFWRCVSGMESPMDYVAGLSLTFEQANLDFARHFAQGFAQIGDAETAQLLERIYRDEIGHVAYGLKWFRRWKNPNESDWEAFCRQLKFPLSPQRAKGFRLNRTGREAAGLDSSFIAELEVYARSRGRTPGVYWFNPYAEGHVARGRAFTPTATQRQLAADFAGLPMFLARQDDIVIAPRPGVEFLREIQQAGFPLPEFVSDACELRDRKLGWLRPWAWSPDSVALAEPLVSRAAGGVGFEEHFNPAIARLYSKAWSAEFLRMWIETAARDTWWCDPEDVGVVACDRSGAMDAIAAIRARGHHRVVVKEALGLAGQNALRLWEPAFTPAQQRWIERAITRGSELVIEPWHERLVDFSMQGEMTARGLELYGFTTLSTDAAGRYLGNHAAPHWRRRLPAEVTACFADARGVIDRLQRLWAELRMRLGSELSRIGFSGPVGVDAFVFRDRAGRARLKPIVEINPRYTMGRLLLELMAHVAPGSSGALRILNASALRTRGAADFASYARDLRTQHPVQREGEPVARIREGVVCLNDPAQAQVALMVFEVGRAT